MSKGLIKSHDLHRMVYNVLLYSGKSTAVQGTTLWRSDGYQLEAVAYDDYFALSDIAATTQAELKGFWATMELDDLKTLEKDLRARENDYPMSDLPLAFSTVHASPVDALMKAQDFCFPEAWGKPTSLAVWAVAPDRLRKLSLIKPGKFPIDLKIFEVNGEEFVGFKVGPTVRGAIATLDRAKLEDIYKGAELWR